MNDTTPSHYVRPLPTNLPSTNLNLASPQMDGISGEGTDVQLRQYLQLVLKYRLLIATVIGASVILSLVYAFTATPSYTASSKVRISTYEPVLTATKIEDMLQEKSKETNYLETQLEEMKSFSLADKILENEEIKSGLEAIRAKSSIRSWLSSLWSSSNEKGQVGESSYHNSLQKLESYLNLISVKPVRRTSLVTIEATTTSPSLSALIANRHAAEYINWVRAVRVEQQSRGLDFLKSQAEELREKVSDLEREVADYAEANSIIAVNKDENITVQKMSQLNDLLTKAEGKRIELENIYKESERALSTDSAGFDDLSLNNARSELAKLQSEYGELSAKFTPSYPKLKQLAAQIDQMKRAVEGQRKQIVIGLKAKAMAAAQEEKNLRDELEQQKSLAFELSKRQVQYNVLNRELTSSRELLQNVLRQIKETSLAVESNSSNVSIVDYAVIPLSPSAPNKKLTLFIGLLLGVIGGLCLAFLLAYLDNTVRTPEQLSGLLGLPALGVVPSFGLEFLPEPQAEKGKQTDGANVEDEGAASHGDLFSSEEPQFGGETDDTQAAGGTESLPSVPALEDLPIMYVQDPKSLASEAYRTIRTGILLSQAGQPPRTILVSSAQSSEGKTTASVNLAASLASTGGKVVLIDADLRRPSVHKYFGIASVSSGLVDLLTGHASLEQACLPEVIKRVSVIPAGQIPPNPAELLGSVEMATLIDQLAQIFDYVLIDSPPILPVTDSVVLSRYVDGVLLVVRAAATPKKVVRDAKMRLQSVGARFLGTILNGIDLKGGDYAYYNRYYYAYYQSDDATASKSGKKAHKRAANG